MRRDAQNSVLLPLFSCQSENIVPERVELTGWDQIASYLKVAVRTAQTYEHEQGLPVYRFPGSKGRVWAVAEELAAWRRNAHQVRLCAAFVRSVSEECLFSPDSLIADMLATAPRPVEPLAVPPPLVEHHLDAAFVVAPSPTEQGSVAPTTIATPFKSARDSQAVAGRVPWKWILGVALVSAAGFLGFSFYHHRGYPFELTIDGSVIRVLDAQKNALWRFVFPTRVATGNGAEALFADLDGDGRKELLFPYENIDREGQPGVLYCFSSNGDKLWTHPVGRELRTVGTNRVYPANYTLVWIRVLKKQTPSGGVILVGGHRGGTSLFVVELLTKEGKRVGEYYHPGWLWAVETADLDGDGYDEILLGGVNNAYGIIGNGKHGTTLVVLDSKRVEGQGPVPAGDDRVMAGLTSNNEKAVILFPDLPTRDPSPVNSFFWIPRIRAISGQVEVIVENDENSNIKADYWLTPDLQLDVVEPSLHMKTEMISKIPKGATQTEILQLYRREFGDLKVLKNQLASASEAKSRQQ